MKNHLIEITVLVVGKKLTVAKVFSKHRRNDLSLFMLFDSNTPIASKIFHQLLEFDAIMEFLVLSLDNDAISWSVSLEKLYSVRSCYALLNDGGLRSQHVMDIWKCNAYLKTKVFT